jgi:SRSO17 transposase
MDIEISPALLCLVTVCERLADFHDRYSSFFSSGVHDLSEVSGHYLHGLFLSGKKNMERIEEVVCGSVYENLQNFISDSPWQEKPLLTQIGKDANNLLGGQEDSCLLLDESGFPKKGTKSVGVKRQWCGEVGKVENCQVGVFMSLCRGNNAVPINYRLFLPQDWTDDQVRCYKAKIPLKHQEYKSKHQLALEMVVEARQNNLSYNWIGADGFYGESPWLLRQLDDLDETFLIDVHKSQHVYLQDPKPIVPSNESKVGKVGRKFTRLMSQTDSVGVDKHVSQQPDSSWQKMVIRDSTKGELEVEILHTQVWVWSSQLQEKEGHLWHLVVRREVNAPETIKYSLSNAPSDTSVERLAYMQAQRYWIERTFQDAKNGCGMGDYQVRGWIGWHHHMAMVLLAMLFMTEERLLHKESIELLSCTDIIQLLKTILPRRDITVAEVLRQIAIRHKKRLSSINSAYRKQMEKLE